MKKVILAVVALVVLPLLVTVGSVVFAFSKLQAAPAEGKDLTGGARLVNDGFANFYLLPVTGGAALVDCGNDDQGAAILAELKKRSLTPADVKAIFLTHGHPDHVGACHLFPQAEVYAFAGDVGLAGGTSKSKGPIPKWMLTPAEKQIKVTKQLTDGETITVGDRQVTAFAVPGHTAGSASYLSGGILIMGDNANVAKTGELKAAMWWFSDDQDENARSLLALAKRLQEKGEKVDLIAYGHSAPSEGIKALTEFKP